jgi:uncharacterized protein (TIGR03086 family)
MDPISVLRKAVDQTGRIVAGVKPERRAAVLRDSLAQPNVIDRTWTMPFGEVPGVAAVGFATLELFQHGWDVARASGQQIDFDADVTEFAGATAQAVPAEQIRIAGVFGAEGSCPPDASAEDRLAAFLGRPL